MWKPEAPRRHHRPAVAVACGFVLLAALSGVRRVAGPARGAAAALRAAADDDGGGADDDDGTLTVTITHEDFLALDSVQTFLAEVGVSADASFDDVLYQYVPRELTFELDEVSERKTFPLPPRNVPSLTRELSRHARRSSRATSARRRSAATSRRTSRTRATTARAPSSRATC